MFRFFDLLLSSSALVFLSPLLVPIMLILRLTGEGEVFYLQERVGKGGRTFHLFKFATMLKNSPSIGTGTITIIDDPRILPFGKFLRKTKINELPQLLNVLYGDMSLIGPRPLTEETFSAYPPESKIQIQLVRPGLSGIGSIIFRNEEELLSNSKDAKGLYFKEIAPFKGQLESWFVKNYSLKIYFLLILLTIVVVIFPRTSIVWKIFPSLPIPSISDKNIYNFFIGKS